MNDVFRVSESSDANSAAFSRLAVPTHVDSQDTGSKVPSRELNSLDCG